jgi:voltage-gated potassium channel
MWPTCGRTSLTFCHTDDMADQTSVPKLTDLTRGEHVRLIGASIIRILIGFAVIWLALSFVPETPGIDLAGPIVVIVSCIVIYSWYFRRQLKKIKRSKFPQLAAVEALILIATMFLAVFAAIYVMESTASPSAFSEDLDHFTAYYFALTILATVGFGDITPVSNIARATAMVQMAIDIAFIAVLVRIISSVATNTIKSRSVAKSNDSQSGD